jgi:hypothetical protein
MRGLNFLLGAGLVILTSCVSERGVTKILVARDPGGAILGTASLPGTYYNVSHDGPSYDDVKVRTNKGTTSGEVLLRFFNQRLRTVVLSDECFAVTTDGKFTARTATTEEWDKADPAESRDVANAREDTVISAPAKAEPLVFRGIVFRASGLTVGQGFGSASGKYLASRSTTIKEHRSWFEMPAPGLGHGETREEYVEIFDVRSGNRLVAAYSTELGAIGAGFGTWLKDRVFVLPYSDGDINHDMRFCLLAILPEK